MEQLGVISPITGPTDWCSGIVVEPKANASVRLCVALTALNRSVKRKIHLMASVDSSLAQLSSSNSQFFSKLDMNSAFWQLSVPQNSPRCHHDFVTI